MTVNFSPLRSLRGFSSPGFVVSPTGDLSLSGDATIIGSLEASELIINGISLLESEDSTVSLSTAIINSSLTTLGVLEKLEVEGDVYIGIASTNFISIDNGTVVINSSEIGSIDNIAIGQNTPSNANFNEVAIGQIGNTGQLDIVGSLTVSDTATIATATIATVNSVAIEADDVTVNNIPTELYHATRKDYVDSRISALSIALGA